MVRENRANPSDPSQSHGGDDSRRRGQRLGVRSPGETTKDGGGATSGPARRAERRPEMIRQRREERRIAYERQRRQWMLTRLGFIALAVLVLAGVGYGIFRYVDDRNLNRVPEGTVSFEYAGSDHTASLDETVEYAQMPPVGGRHAPSPFWQNCGFYAEPIRNESGVHSLEHGAVWVTYDPDLPTDQIEQLRQIADDQTFVLVSPFADLPSSVVASAWNRQIQLDDANDERLDQFIRRFRLADTAPERGGACTGGVGTPV